MSYENSRHTAGGARRGLATIAFLKARFDAGMDHLEMFQPFVDDAVRRFPRTDIEIADVVQQIRQSTGLSVPSETVQTLLRRAVKRGMLERHGGRYFRSQDYGEDEELPRRLRELESAHLGLGSRLREFAAARGETLSSDDAALAVLMRFLDANHIGIVLGQATTTGPATNLDHIASPGRSTAVHTATSWCIGCSGAAAGRSIQAAFAIERKCTSGSRLPESISRYHS